MHRHFGLSAFLRYLQLALCAILVEDDDKLVAVAIAYENLIFRVGHVYAGEVFKGHYAESRAREGHIVARRDGAADSLEKRAHTARGSLARVFVVVIFASYSLNS